MAATVSFRLNRPKEKNGEPKTTPVSILIAYYRNGLEVELSCDIKVIPGEWTGTRIKKDAPRSGKLNKILSDIENSLLNIELDYPGIPREREEALARTIIKQLNPEKEQKKTVEPWIKQFIIDAKVKESTKQVYRASLDHLTDYVTKKNIHLTWESFDLDFYEGFTAYLYSIPHCDNTVGKTIKTIKTFLSQAFDRDLHTNLNYKKKGFRVISAEVDEIYLSEEELFRYYNVSIPEYEDDKKLFVFDCWVGLRFGDLQKLGPYNHIETMDGPALKVVTEKTGEEVIIPLHPIAQEIWESWNGIPPKRCNQNFNEAIKVIAEKAGIDQMVQKRNTIKGKVIVEWVPKHTMVKAHTCRRSFATNSVLRGIPDRTIMMVTGHKTEKSFKKYVRITKEQHAGIMAGYFKKDNVILLRKAN